MRVIAAVKHQWCLWLVALGFFTRIKIKPLPNFEQAWLNQASRYYGLVGLLVGALSAGAYWLCALFLPQSIAILLAMIASVLITGGFHEDGLADTWDGFGGGWSIAQKLTIMKDSRLGTYGTLALILALLLKFQLLLELATLSSPSLLSVIIASLISAHCLSRILAVSLIFDQVYVRDIDSSKVKPMTEQQSSSELTILLCSALLVLLVMPVALFATIIAVQLILRLVIVKWYRAQLGGYTGDLLGQAQQLSELVIYITILAFYRQR